MYLQSIDRYQHYKMIAGLIRSPHPTTHHLKVFPPATRVVFILPNCPVTLVSVLFSRATVVTNATARTARFRFHQLVSTRVRPSRFHLVPVPPHHSPSRFPFGHCHPFDLSLTSNRNTHTHTLAYRDSNGHMQRFWGLMTLSLSL